MRVDNNTKATYISFILLVGNKYAHSSLYPCNFIFIRFFCSIILLYLRQHPLDRFHRLYVITFTN